MIKSVSENRLQEYLTVAVLSTLVFLAGLLSIFYEEDVEVIVFTALSIVGALYYLRDIPPVHLLFCLCFGVSFLPYVSLEIFPLAGSYIVALVFVLFYLFLFINGDDALSIPLPAKWLALLIGIGILTTIVAPDKKASVVYIGQLFIYLCVYIAVSNTLDTKAKVVRALEYIIYGSLVTFIICIIQLLVSVVSFQAVIDLFFNSMVGELLIGSNGLERIGDSADILINRGSNVALDKGAVLFRVFGTFEGPTIFGWYLLIVVLLVAGLFFGQFSNRRVIMKKASNAALLALMVFFLVFTWTRSALLAFVAGGVLILFYRRKRSIYIFTAKFFKRVVICLAVVISLIVVLWIFDYSFPIEYFLQFFQAKRLGGSTVGRLLTIFFAISYISQHPVLGIGLGNYKYAQPGIDASADASFASAHNTYLELGVELGIPGLIVFIVIICSFFRQASVLVKAPINSFYHTLGICFAAIWVGFALVSMFGGNLIHPRFMTMLWILAGVQTASYHLYLNEQKEKHTIYRFEIAD